MEELPNSAVALLSSRNESTPFTCAQWFELFSRYVAPGQGEVQWLILYEGEETRLLLPMLEYREGGRKFLKSLSNYYSPYFDCISTCDDNDDLLETLLRLASDYLKQYDEVELYPLTEKVKTTFLCSLKNQGFYIRPYTYSHNWRYKNIAGFEEYWSSINSRLRSTVKRKQKKFEADGCIEYSIARPENIDAALLDYQKVYANSWKASESHPRFIESLVRHWSEAGLLRLGLIHKNGVPLAAQIWLVSNGTAYIYKLAYEKSHADYSVGTLLSRYLFETVITTDKVHTIDYLTGDDGYKADWMSSRRALYGLKCSNLRTPRGLIAGGRSFAGALYDRLFTTPQA